MSQSLPTSKLGSQANLTIRHFLPADQEFAKQLILGGLEEHFGCINPQLNPDLDAIQANYVERGDLFLIAEIDNRPVGTGGLIKEAPGVGRIVRVSVDKRE
ncbi:MAG: hypothetical protein R3293_14265, partial [Candidatus Promineifilaceae bacterium]|nr:hypothetical protein [Candidatus Promineifilaceae bacterium]